MRRPVLIVLGLLLALGLMSGTAVAKPGWGDVPEHGHFLLQKVEIQTEELIWIDDEPYLQLEFSFRRCVDLAGGKPLPVLKQHTQVHTGKMNEMLEAHAGHIVVPTEPLFPYADCDELLEAFPDREVSLQIPLPPPPPDPEE